MKRIAIYCVTYNSYEALKAYLHSVDEAAGRANGLAEVSVFVTDNTESATCPLDSDSLKWIQLRVFAVHKNLGYFGAVNHAMKEVDPRQFDYSIISNVDLIMDEAFFVKLCDNAQSESEDSVGWIAPQIWSEKEGRDRNPKVLSRYPLRKLKILRTFFQFPFIWYLYNRTVYRKKRFERHPAGRIYAGHGSFIILTKRFFEQCGIIDYPVFLFCEEIYLAEQCRGAQLSVVYQPDLKVRDAEHASTGRMSLRTYTRYNYEAVQYIINHYY